MKKVARWEKSTFIVWVGETIIIERAVMKGSKELIPKTKQWRSRSNREKSNIAPIIILLTECRIDKRIDKVL